MKGMLRLSRWASPLVMPRVTRADGWMLAAVACLVSLGIVMVFNVSYFHAEDRYGHPLAFFWKHLAAVGVGTMALIVASRLRPELLEKWANVAFLISLVALLLVLVPGIGVVRNGARRWVCAGGSCFQPAEIAKVAVVFFLARTISRRRERMTEFVAGLVPPLVGVGVCMGLMLRQPDFGTTVIMGIVMLLMLFVGGARIVHLGGLGLAALGLAVIAVVRSDNRTDRVLAFLDPWEHSQDSAFQLVQSLIAFGSGGPVGIGLGQSRQKMFFLPEAHTDFIFALIGEELGLWGALAVLLLFGIIALRGFRVAARHPDSFASLLAFGLTLVVVIGAVVNVGVVLGCLPTKGLALPFVSYGGSALLGAMIEIGLLAALSRMTG